MSFVRFFISVFIPLIEFFKVVAVIEAVVCEAASPVVVVVKIEVLDAAFMFSTLTPAEAKAPICCCFVNSEVEMIVIFCSSSKSFKIFLYARLLPVPLFITSLNCFCAVVNLLVFSPTEFNC